MRRLAAAVFIVALCVTVAPDQAQARPDWGFTAGRTFAVGSPQIDAFNQGGFTAAGSALWPWNDRFRFGATMFASDLGNEVRQVTLADAGGGPPKVYGSIDFGHRGAWGAAWRVDALGPGLGRNFRSYATGSYGYVRFVHDRVGSLKDAHSGVVGSLGLGVERTLNPHHALGLNAGGTWLSDDFTRRYGSAALEWRWHW